MPQGFKAHYDAQVGASEYPGSANSNPSFLSLKGFASHKALIGSPIPSVAPVQVLGMTEVQQEEGKSFMSEYGNIFIQVVRSTPLKLEKDSISVYYRQPFRMYANYINLSRSADWDGHPDVPCNCAWCTV